MMTYLSTLLQNPRARLLCLAGAALMYLTIITVGNIPGARADIGAFAPGPVLHALAYAILAALWFVGSRGTPLARACKAVLAVAAMGAGDEFVQSFFPYRGADVRDWAVDCGQHHGRADIARHRRRRTLICSRLLYSPRS
jgi:hypothetical protein